jgi:FolB domain-containing protein
MNDRLRINDLRFHGRHGALPEERERGQWFEVDVDLGYDQRPASASDDLADAVDVRAVSETVREIVVGDPVSLMETLAQQIADRLLALSSVRDVVLRVRKPQARLFDASEHGYEIEISRTAGGPERSGSSGE